jgi:WD40 repeat protein
MTDHKIETTITGGQIQGVAGAGTVVIENFTIYNRAVEELAAAPSTEPIPPCPYPGLAYFGPGDADLFFGRDAAIARLAEAVSLQSLTALVGASGSGKSSVVLAGLAPRLHRAGEAWRFTHFRIGTELERNPFLALARALVPLYVASDSDTERLKNTKLLATSLQTGELTLRDVCADCRSRNKGKRILLIADQFEEAFTLVEDEAVRHRFIDVLLAGFPDPKPGGSPDICLILTLRADFYGRALRHRPLADALQGHVENLGPMTREELQAAILRPAENVKVSFEPGLVETVLDEVESKPGSLPLLQFALREMWGRQEKGTITRKCYDDIGGVEGALAQRAETIFATLTEDGKNPQMEKDFRRLFTRLVTLGEGQEDTRRVVERRELGDEVWSLAQRLAGEDNRLVVTNAPVFSRETAEVAHEALIRHWPKLVEWINRDRAFQSWLRQIKSNIELWSADPTDEGPLLRGGMLAQGRDWLNRRRDDLSPAEQGYIEASLALRQRAEAEKEAARKERERQLQELAETSKQLAAEQTAKSKLAEMSRRKIQRWLAATVILAIAAVLLGVVVELGRESAVEQQRIALSQQLAAQSKSLIAGEAKTTQESVLLGIESLRLYHNADSELALRNSLRLLPRLLNHYQLPVTERGAGVLIALSADDAFLATGSPNGDVAVWNLRAGTPVFRVRHDKGITALTFDPKGQYLATGGRDGHAKLWRMPSGDPVQTVEQLAKRGLMIYSGRSARAYAGRVAAVTALAFSSDGQHLAIAGEDGRLRLLDVQSGRSHVVLSQESPIDHIEFSVDGRFIAAKDANQLMVWEVTGGTDDDRIMMATRASDFAFDRQGRHLVTVDQLSPPVEWDITTGRKKTRPWLTANRKIGFSSDGQSVWATSGDPSINAGTILAVSPDGIYLIADGKGARLWDASTHDEIARLSYWEGIGVEPAILRGAFANQSPMVVTVAIDGSVGLWSFEPGGDLVASVRGDTIRFAQDDSLMLTAEGGRKNAVSTWKIPAVTMTSSAMFQAGAKNITITDDAKALITISADKVSITISTMDINGGNVLTTKLDLGTMTASNLGDSVRSVTPVGSVTVSPNGRYLVVNFDKRRFLWELDAGRNRLLKDLGDHSYDAIFSPDSTELVIAATPEGQADGTVEVIQLTGNASTKWSYPRRIFFHPCVSHDGKYLAISEAVDAESVVILRLDDGTEIRRFNKFGGQIRALAFSPDDQYLAAGLADNTASIRSVDTDKEIAHVGRPAKDKAFVESVLFSPKQSYFATRSNDRIVRLWNWRPEALIEEACSRLRRNLTYREWGEFFRDSEYDVTCKKDLPPHPSVILAAADKAKSGDVNHAIQIVERAIELGAPFDQNPREWAQKFQAKGLAESAVTMALRGAIESAQTAISRAQELDPEVPITSTDWNAICWEGAIRNKPSEVMTACDRAVELDPDDGGIRDSRGLARALTGDYGGAIDDFQAFIDWGSKNNRRSPRSLLQRKRWIEELGQKRNPITSREMIIDQDLERAFNLSK